MFAPRYDPNAVIEDVPRLPLQLMSRKRKLEAAQSNASSDDSSSDFEKETSKENATKSSESDDSSSSDSDSHSDSDSDSDSDSNSSSSSSSDTDTDTISKTDSHGIQEQQSSGLSSAKNLITVISKESRDDHQSTSNIRISKDKENIDVSVVPAKRDDDMAIDYSDAEATNNDGPNESVHAKILQKFARSTELNKNISQSESESDSDTDMADVKDLAPMPQPVLPRDQNLRSHYFHHKNLEWLASPIYAAPEITKPFFEFQLSARMKQNLKTEGFKDAFSVQVAVLNTMLEDLRKNTLAPDFQGDILVNASTGSGKTLAYSIPIIEALHTRVVPRLRAVVLVPTKPLIGQVAATMRSLAAGTALSIIALSGDKSVKEESFRMVRREPDIIVSTPGRLVDHLLNKSISFKALRFLVIDEADRLLNESYQNWCEVVVKTLEDDPKPEENTAKVWRLKPQKLVFSATLTTDAGKLSLLKFDKPRLLVVNGKEQLASESFSVPSLLMEHKLRFKSSESELKPLLLARFLLDTNKLRSVLVFARSNDATLRLTRILGDLFTDLAPGSKTTVAYLNSTNNVSGARKRILKDFVDERIGILVATDLIARGLDVSRITSVVNYDMPNSSREYVHRVGRTARANQRGEAFTMCFGGGESGWFSKITADIGRVNSINVIQGEEASENDKVAYAKVMKKFQEEMRGSKK